MTFERGTRLRRDGPKGKDKGAIKSGEIGLNSTGMDENSGVDSNNPGPEDFQPVQDESPPESVQSYRNSLKGVTGALGSLWSSSISPKKGLAEKREEDSEKANLLQQTASLTSSGELEAGGKAEGDDEYVKITRRLMQMDGSSPSADPQTPETVLPGARSPGAQNWLNKSVSKVLGWGQAGETADSFQTPRGQEIVHNISEQLTTHAAAIAHLLPHLPAEASAKELEELLVWKEPLQSAKVAGMGGYALICIRHLLNGTDLVQPSTVLAFMSICCIVWSCFTTAPLNKGGRGQVAQTSRKEMEQRVTAALSKLVPLLTAICCLLSKHLFGGSKTGSSVWLGLVLWMVIIVAESGWVSQTSLMLWLWGALFTLPSVYVACQSVLEDLVDECISFGLKATQKDRRAVTAASSVVGAIAFGLLDIRIFIRVTLAICTSFAFLIWHEKYIRNKTSDEHLKEA